MSENMFRRRTMQSFRSKVLSAFALAAPVLAAVLPRDHSVARLDGPPPLVKLDLHEGYAQASFNVPCPGCLGHGDEAYGDDDESLLLSFGTHAAEEPCGSSSNITVNGLQLSQQWLGNTAYGEEILSIKVPSKEHGTRERFVSIEWETVCLPPNERNIDLQPHQPTIDNATAQVLSLRVRKVNEDTPSKPAGFTLSFTQSSPPELLRFEALPHAKGDAESWRSPPAHLRVLPSTTSDDRPVNAAPSQDSLEEELEDLRALQLKALDIHRAIIEKEDRVTKALFKDCDSIPCVCKNVVKVISHKPKAAWRLGLEYMGFRRPQTPVMGHAHNEASNTERNAEPIVVTSDLPYLLSTGISAQDHPRRSSSHFLAIALSILATVLCCGCVTVTVRRCRHKCCEHVEKTLPRRSRQSRWRAWFSRRSHHDQTRMDYYDEKRRLINSQEDVLEDVMQDEIRHLRHAHGLVNSLVQAEEARVSRPIDVQPGGPTYPPRGFTYNFPPTSSPYENGPPPTLGPYHTQGFTNNYPMPPSPTSSTYQSSNGFSSRPLSRTSTNSSLPGYTSSNGAPPAYEDHDHVASRVVNGLSNYRPRGSSMGSNDSRWTPDSSVVDVSPRRSAETLRSTYMVFEDVDVGAD